MKLKDILKNTEMKNFTFIYLDETIKYRPYKTKEEKELLIALTTNDYKTIENTLFNIIIECTTIENPKQYPLFVLFELVKNIRIVSVGNIIDFEPICECGTKNAMQIKLDNVTFLPPKENLKLRLDENIEIEFKYLTIENETHIIEEIELNNLNSDFLYKKNKDRTKEEIQQYQENKINSALYKIACMIYKVKTKDNVLKDMDIQERLEFVYELNREYRNRIIDFIMNIEKKIPSTTIVEVSNCVKCGKELKEEFGGNLIDFFVN